MDKSREKQNLINRLTNSLISSKGFTFIELLVAMSVFAIIITSIAGTFAAVINAHRKAVAIQNTEEAGRYILEMMGKEIRMGVINTGTRRSQHFLFNNEYNKLPCPAETFDYQFDEIIS